MSDKRKPKSFTQKLPRYLFILSVCFVFMGYGYFIHRNKLFPYNFIQDAFAGYRAIVSESKGYSDWFYTKTDFVQHIPTYQKGAAYEGLSLLASIVGNDTISVRVIDMDGSVVHRWKVDWFDVWPDATHLTDLEMPKARPGTHIHGMVLLNNGDLIFNYEHLGLVRLDACSNVVWRLPYRTHHSIHMDQDSMLWISGQVNYDDKINPDYPNAIPPYVAPTVVKVSLDGEILKEISIMDLFSDNRLKSLIYMSSVENRSTKVTGDLLHLNDVETFPADMEPGVFEPGDIMMSLRNINAVVVFNGETEKIKHVIIDDFVRQHDPDFVDGNTISLFDNNNTAPYNFGHQSRIVVKSFSPDTSYVYYTGTEDHPFYSDIMGKHQWLPNGNLLVTAGAMGRAFEIDSTGQIVWEYVNILKDNYAGILEEVHRLPKEFDEPFFRGLQSSCPEKED